VKRISYWVLSTVSAVVLLFGFDASQRGGTTATTNALSGGTSGSSDPGANNGTSSGPTHDRSKFGSSSGSTDSSTKTVTGSVAQTQWGPVQVELTVGHGSITKVSVLQYPNGNGTDVAIANYSLPILIQETMRSQNANIDMVSGATYTSTGYIQSLQSALDQAHL